MVAQELAVTAPARVERLALLCTSPGGAGGSSYPLHELVGGGATPLVLDSRYTPDWLATHPDEAVLADGFVGRWAEHASPGFLMQLEARRHHDVWDRLDRVTCPTLVAAGRWDGIAPVANSEAIAARVADAELRVYEGGHAFFAQDRRALPETIEFLATGSAAAPT
jgi:pimeloyl-ACP methyl ester carboxylesterase